MEDAFKITLSHSQCSSQETFLLPFFYLFIIIFFTFSLSCKILKVWDTSINDTVRKMLLHLQVTFPTWNKVFCALLLSDGTHGFANSQCFRDG